VSGDLIVRGPDGEVTLDISGPGRLRWGNRYLTAMIFEQFDEDDLFDIHSPNPVSLKDFEFIKGKALIRINYYSSPVKAKIDKPATLRIMWIDHTNWVYTCILKKTTNKINNICDNLIDDPFKYRLFKRSGGRDHMLHAAPNGAWQTIKDYAPDGVTIPNDLRSKRIEVPSITNLKLDNNEYVVGDIRQTDVYVHNKGEIDRFENEATDKIVKVYTIVKDHHANNVNTYNYNIEYLKQALQLKTLGK